MQRYPKFLYSATEPAVIVQDEAEHAALGAGWFESPAEAAASVVVESSGMMANNPIGGPDSPRRRGRPRKVAE
jgi:hypothetical protein